VKKSVAWIVTFGIAVILGVASYLTYSAWSPLVSPFALGLCDILGRQETIRSVPYLVLGLVALVELILALVLRQRNRAFEAEREANAALHQKELDLLRQEIALLQ